MASTQLNIFLLTTDALMFRWQHSNADQAGKTVTFKFMMHAVVLTHAQRTTMSDEQKGSKLIKDL